LPSENPFVVRRQSLATTALSIGAHDLTPKTCPRIKQARDEKVEDLDRSAEALLGAVSTQKADVTMPAQLSRPQASTAVRRLSFDF
jgi:hypothetical protein